MNTLLKTLALASSLALLGGCASSGGTGGDGTGTGTGTDAYGASGGSVWGNGRGGAGAGGAGGVGGPEASLEQRVVYFDFDSADIRADSRTIVDANAQYLKQNPGAATILEGHTDERGSREYNIALGERRGTAVRRAMEGMGVNPQQLRVVSYGKERPAVAGHDEAAYSQNRRVEIAY